MQTLPLDLNEFTLVYPVTREFFMKSTLFKPLFMAMSVLLSTVFIFSACSDDSPTETPPVVEKEFSIEFEVLDVQGSPVEGIQLTLFNDHDFFQGKSKNRAAIRIQFTVAEDAPIVLYVNDAKGDTVNTLVHGWVQAGVHQVMWNGRDDREELQNSGRYTAQLRIYSEGSFLAYSDSLGILLSQPDADMFVATTNANGIIVLEDKTLFPQLFNLPDMMATDENGDELGLFTVTDTMHFYFRDAATMVTMHKMYNINENINRVTYVWDPLKESGSPLFQRVKTQNYSLVGVDQPVDKDFVNHLDNAFPNPFN